MDGPGLLVCKNFITGKLRIIPLGSRRGRPLLAGVENTAHKFQCLL